MMFRFLDSRRDAGEMGDRGYEATGTYADGIVPVPLRNEGGENVALRMRSSYGRDLVAAHRLVDQVPVFH